MSTKQRHCAICGELAAVLATGSKIKHGAVVICHDCWGEDKQAKEEPYHPGEMPDFLKELFKV